MMTLATIPSVSLVGEASSANRLIFRYSVIYRRLKRLNFFLSKPSMPKAFTTRTPDIVSWSTEVMSAIRSCARMLPFRSLRLMMPMSSTLSGTSTKVRSDSLHEVTTTMAMAIKVMSPLRTMLASPPTTTPLRFVTSFVILDMRCPVLCRSKNDMGSLWTVPYSSSRMRQRIDCSRYIVRYVLM